MLNQLQLRRLIQRLLDKGWDYAEILMFLESVQTDIAKEIAIKSVDCAFKYMHQ